MRSAVHLALEAQKAHQIDWKGLTAAIAASVAAVAGLIEILRRFVRWWQMRRHPAPPDTAAVITEFASRVRSDLLERVRAQRIVNGLERSLQHVAEMHLDVLNAPDLVKSSYARSTALQGQRSSPEEAYRQAGGQLVILGPAGCGKTTLALKLMRDLLEKCNDDDTAPIPEIFPLASWAAEREPLVQWMADLCQVRHGWAAPKWRCVIDEGFVAPFLDGLDEVDADQRTACLQEINHFWEGGRGSIVLCSRLAEYAELPERVKLGGAVIVSSPDPEAIDTYLAGLGQQWDALRLRLRDDQDPDGLGKMLATPLMLNIAVIGYSTGDPISLPAHDDIRGYRERLWAQYVSTVRVHAYDPIKGLLPDAEDEPPYYSQEQALAWLGWLSKEMQRTNRSELWLHEWICSPRLRWQLRLVGSTILGACVSFWSNLGLGIGFGTLSMVLTGLQFSNSPAYRRKFVWKPILRRCRNSFLFGVGAGLLLGIVTGLLIGATFALEKGSYRQLGDNLIVAASFGMLVGLPLGLGFASASVFIDFGPEKDQLAPQGPTDTIRASGRLGLLTALTIGVVVGVVVGQFVDTLAGLVSGSAIGILAGLAFGLEFVAFHYALRLQMLLHGWGPFRWSRFLEWAGSHLFFQRSGAAYEWMHLELRDYLAKQYLSRLTLESISATRVDVPAE